LAGISRGKPALFADYIAARRQNPFADPLAFAVLENNVNPERDYRSQDDRENEKQNDDDD